MNRQMPTSDTKDAEPQWNDTRDYLADPALWFDVLPQPFRMIDQLLSGILETVWETIEEREESKKREQSKFRVPMCSKVEVIEAVTGAKCICGGRDGIIFVGCSDGLRAFQVTKGGRPQLVGGAGGHSVEHLSTGWSGELQLVAAVGGGALSVFAFTKHRLILVSQLQDGNSAKVESASLASSCSHIATTSVSTGAPPTIEIHSLPLQAWASEVQVDLSRQDGSSSSPGSTLVEPPVIYSKTSLVMAIAPPPTFAPCTASDPSQALNNVAARLLSTIATGEHHLLTPNYLENRRKALISQRQDFHTPPLSGNNPPRHAICHFLLCQGQTHIAVIWENQSQVLVYKVECPGKGSQVLPVMVHPHASPISASAVSPDGRVMAIGTKQGAVTLWDHQAGLYRGVIETGSDMVTSLAFMGPGCVVVGTYMGLEVIQQDCRGAWVKNATTLRSGDPSSPVKVAVPLLCGQGICCRVTVGGTTVVWNIHKGQPICQLALPTTTCTAVSDSMQCCSLSLGHAFIVGTSNIEGKNCLLDFSLPEVEEGTNQNEASYTNSQCNMSGNFMEVLEARLCEAIRNGGRA